MRGLPQAKRDRVQLGTNHGPFGRKIFKPKYGRAGVMSGGRSC